MSYAIYALSWKRQELHHEFVSRKKDPVQVWGDVVAYITSYFKGLKTDLVDTMVDLQKTQDDLHAFILDELPNWTLVTLDLIDKDTEERLDEMFEFIDRYREYCDELGFIENRDACVLMSRLDFGLRRIIDRRFSKSWLEVTEEEKEKQQADFIYYSNHLRCFNALRRVDIDMVRFNELTRIWSGPKSILVDSETCKIKPGAYIWWTNQGDCEGVMAYHEKCRLEGMVPWGGPLPDRVYSELRSRHGRHAKGCVWGMDDQPTFDNSNEFHRYILRYCGGILISHEDLTTIRHNQGFITDLDLKPIWDLN
ncbi:hypothetical protein D3C76_26120 [compost metagenome]